MANKIDKENEEHKKFYENFLKYIDKNRIGSFEKKLSNADAIFDCFVQGDLLENEVVQKQIYGFYDYINIIKMSYEDICLAEFLSVCVFLSEKCGNLIREIHDSGNL